MRLLPIVVAVAFVALAVPPAIGLHTAGNGFVTKDSWSVPVPRSFYVPLSTAVWWDHSQVRGVPTGLAEQTHMVEILNSAPVTLTAETFPRNTPDVAKVCGLPRVPDVVVPTVVVHGGACQKDNGYTIQIHYFPWTNDPADPDHVVSPTPGSPAATTVWRVDAVPTSYKEATLPPGHWQVWFDPAVSASEYDVVYRATSSTAFYYDYLGTRGCVFYFNVGGVTDVSLLGCNLGYV